MDDLEKFARTYRDKARNVHYIPQGVVSNYRMGDVTGVLLYRKDIWQVEMWIVPPHYVVPEHTHPNVDSYEMYLGGNIRFSRNGEWATPDDFIAPKDGGIVGRMIRVNANDAHGGVSGDGGGVFLSIQKWLNGHKPHTVAADWDGKAFNDDHQSKVTVGNAEEKGEATWRDAATSASQPPDFSIQG